MTKRQLQAQFSAEGLDSYEWRSPAGDGFDWHSHTFRDVIRCLSGSIVFHLESGDFELQPGDRFEMDPDTLHAATVGENGVVCLEAKS